MSLEIEADDVRARLALDSVELTDDDLDTVTFIPFADAWMTKILEINSTAEADLSDEQIAMLKAAKVIFVAMKVVTRKTDDFQVGPIRIKSGDIKALKDDYEDEINAIFELLDFVKHELTSHVVGGSDYIDNYVMDTDILI